MTIDNSLLLRAHAERAAELVQLEDGSVLPAGQLVRNDFVDLSFGELSRVAAKPGVQLAAPPDQALLEKAGDFILHSFQDSELAGRSAALSERLRSILGVTFTPSDFDQSAFSNPLARLTALRELGYGNSDPLNRGSHAVHELFHAAAPVIVKEWTGGNQPMLGVHGNVAIVSHGWTVHRFKRADAPGPVKLFDAFEEVSAELQGGLFYESHGAFEVRRSTPLQVNLWPNKPGHNALIEAVSLISPASLSMHSDHSADRSARSRYELVFDMPSVSWSDGIRRYESAYCFQLAAFDDLAHEVFPSMPRDAAVPHQRNVLREVQAFGEHRRLTVPMTRAFGTEGRDFLAELQAPRAIDPTRIDNILGTLFAAAGHLPDNHRSMARSLLRRAQQEIQIFAATRR